METIDTIVAKNLTTMTYEKTTTMLVACIEVIRWWSILSLTILQNFIFCRFRYFLLLFYKTKHLAKKTVCSRKLSGNEIYGFLIWVA
jgi:hypothetical protein